jgi:hypothetical protein
MQPERERGGLAGGKGGRETTQAHNGCGSGWVVKLSMVVGRWEWDRRPARLRAVGPGKLR